MRSAHHTRIDVAAVTEAAFVFAYPLVLMELTRRRMRAPPNRLVHTRRAGILSSSAWLDLVAAPVVLSVPEAHGRYYYMALIDMWTNGFASVGPRTTGTTGGAYAIGLSSARARELPAGVTPITAPTRYVRLVGETCLERGEAEATAPAIERGYALTALGGQPARDTGAAADRAAGTTAVERVERMSARTFFGMACRLLADNPPPAEDRRLIERARPVGLFTAGADLSRQDGVEEGAARGREAVRARAAAVIEEARGRWHIEARRGGFGSDHLSRAAAARAPLGGNVPADVLPALTHTDAAGRPLSGCHRYVLQFDPDAPPPVHGFWSLSAHAAPREEDAAPSSLGDRDGLTVDPDGSLRIHIQCDRPPRESRSNWLPAPAGDFALVLRLHWPHDGLVAGRWTPPAVARLG